MTNPIVPMTMLALGAVAPVWAQANADDKPSFQEQILDQVVANCWPDLSDLRDHGDLRAVIVVKFGRDGYFLDTPRLIQPKESPRASSPLQTFIVRALRELEKCNARGFRIPEEYFAAGSPVVELHYSKQPKRSEPVG